MSSRFDTSQVPESLSRRPVDTRRNLPIPVMNMRPADPTNFEGEPDTADFSAVWGPTVLDCGENRRCGLCGEDLDYWVAFLGGPKSAKSRAYIDPPFHPDCCEAALGLCPHIAIPHHRRAPESRLGEAVSVPQGFDAARTDEWVMGITRDYTMEFRQNSLIFRPAPFKSMRRFGYVDGSLKEIR